MLDPITAAVNRQCRFAGFVGKSDRCVVFPQRQFSSRSSPPRATCSPSPLSSCCLFKSTATRRSGTVCMLPTERVFENHALISCQVVSVQEAPFSQLARTLHGSNVSDIRVDRNPNRLTEEYFTGCERFSLFASVFLFLCVHCSNTHTHAHTQGQTHARGICPALTSMCARFAFFTAFLALSLLILMWFSSQFLAGEPSYVYATG